MAPKRSSDSTSTTNSSDEEQDENIPKQKSGNSVPVIIPIVVTAATGTLQDGNQITTGTNASSTLTDTGSHTGTNGNDSVDSQDYISQSMRSGNMMTNEAKDTAQWKKIKEFMPNFIRGFRFLPNKMPKDGIHAKVWYKHMRITNNEAQVSFWDKYEVRIQKLVNRNRNDVTNAVKKVVTGTYIVYWKFRCAFLYTCFYSHSTHTICAVV